VHKQRQHSNGEEVAEQAATPSLKSSNVPRDDATSKPTTGSLTPTTQEAHDAKQQLFESLRDKGTGLFEILKQKGGQELDKIKQGTGGGLPWQRKDLGSVGSKGRAGSAPNTSGLSADMNSTPNDYVHGTKARLESFHSENSTTASD
jgi:hypothetical protein